MRCLFSTIVFALHGLQSGLLFCKMSEPGEFQVSIYSLIYNHKICKQDWETHRLTHTSKKAENSQVAMFSKTKSMKSSNSMPSLITKKNAAQERLAKVKATQNADNSNGKNKIEDLVATWKKSMKLTENEDGFVPVKAMNIFEDSNYDVYSVIPMSSYTDFSIYNQNIQTVYARSTDIVLMRELQPGDLVMAIMKGLWARCRIISFYPNSNSVSLECIDDGRKEIFNERSIFKSPKAKEFETPAFSFKMIIENNNSSDLKENDVIKVKVVETDADGIQWVQVKSEEEKIDLKRAELLECIQEVRFVSGIELVNQKVEICASTDENNEFYDTINDKIRDYMTRNKSTATCEQSDFVLARHSGGYYRGIVEKLLPGGASIFLIDYCEKFEFVKHEDLVKMPKSFSFDYVSHLCDIKLRNGTDPKKIDAIKTEELMSKNKIFKAKISKVSEDSYEIVIQEKDVVLKE